MRTKSKLLASVSALALLSLAACHSDADEANQTSVEANADANSAVANAEANAAEAHAAAVNENNE